ncbi:flagellar biosynthesis protein FlhF [Oceanobacillus massiliensis]|uniref:flagellar biosynthesis protein FlhF n=1 Tax=Oceanobacillus massiliensis TaxID=1465765 RepID=UPI001F0154A0|nr:flagellar biosynthesis protein FlhF [Oceanobacillus massiliensis]
MPSTNKTRQNEKPKDQDVLQEIQNLKKILQVQTKAENQKFAPVYQVAYNHLIDQEVNEEIAAELVQSLVNANENESENPDFDTIMQFLQSGIEARLDQIGDYGIRYKEKVMQFVGPTGVGKTTTIAKVAAKMMFEDQKKVAFITTDTYRIAAVEQLKTYARILNVPLEVAYTAEDYYHSIEKFSSFDVILVDTAGRNFRDRRYINELKSMLDMDKVYTHLVLSLTSKPKDMEDIFNQFQQLPVHSVIFTKQDETGQYGSILNIVLGKRIGITCITNGQDVPEDLMKATPENISKLLAGDDGEA